MTTREITDMTPKAATPIFPEMRKIMKLKMNITTPDVASVRNSETPLDRISFTYISFGADFTK